MYVNGSLMRKLLMDLISGIVPILDVLSMGLESGFIDKCVVLVMDLRTLSL